MSTMENQQPKGLAAAAQQYENQSQYTYTQNMPPQNYQTSQPPPPPMYNQEAPHRPYNPADMPPMPSVANAYQPQHPSTEHEQAPPLPQRHPSHQIQPESSFPPPPPTPQYYSKPSEDNPADPTHYTRDPHRLVGYLIPFPKPQIEGVDPNAVPSRFLIYTPPPPPLSPPKEGEKEGKLHKVQRKWQQEVRSAKTSTAPIKSWQGVKSRATKAIAWGVNQTTTSNIEFLGRVSDGSNSPKEEGGSRGSSRPTTPESPSAGKKTVGVEEIVLVYPPSMAMDNQQMREEFVNSMLRTKSKAQRDSIIATGLLPVSYGIDILATLIWPFGGLGEIDTVWLYSSVRGAKTASSVTKRLRSSGSSGDPDRDTLQLNFASSPRLDVLTRYLAAECHRVDPARFPAPSVGGSGSGSGVAPTESELLQAIGWHPSQTGGEDRNWEDDQWETAEVKDDIRSNVHKGAKEWRKFCIAFAKDPKKAEKK